MAFMARARMVDQREPTAVMRDADRARYERLVADLQRRLHRACAHMPEDEFCALVERIARVTAHFWEIEADPAFWRTIDSKDRPLAPLPDARGIGSPSLTISNGGVRSST